MLLNVETQVAECVGSLDSGIAFMAWSPDFEIVVLLTCQNSVVLMTQEWETITEDELYHGSDDTNSSSGKNAAEATTDAWVTWRGDGQFFACSSIDPTTQRRSMHVFQRDGSRHSDAGQLAIALTRPIAWRPSGNLIAAVKTPPHYHRHEVVFFERNGLQHGEFELPSSDQVLALEWNSESDILALLVRSVEVRLAHASHVDVTPD